MYWTLLRLPKFILLMTVAFFCCTSMALSAELIPPQSLTQTQESIAPPSENSAAPLESAAPMAPEALAPARYIVIEVMPASGNNSSKGYGINNLTQIVGRTYQYNEITEEIEDHGALFWDPRTGSTTLSTIDGFSGAWGINDTGMACGYATNAAGHRRAVRWDLSDDSLVDLGTLTNPNTMVSGDASYSYRGINNAHTVVGHADIPNDAGDFTLYHGFIYDDANGIRDLGTLSTDTYYMGGYSIAYDINDANVVVGTTNITGWTFRAFVWTDQASMTELPIDGSRPSGEWYATVINESGLIGGHAIDSDTHYPYYWPSKDVSPIAIAMPLSHPNGEFYGVNESGQMVGIMFNAAEEERALIFDTTNGVVDLNNRISPSNGWVLEAAIDINDMGQITGIGSLDGSKRAFLLTPNADPDADIDIDGSDILALVQDLGATNCGGNCPCDFNGDDNVDNMDVALLAMVFGRAI